jgi:hypothetical protein
MRGRVRTKVLQIEPFLSRVTDMSRDMSRPVTTRSCAWRATSEQIADVAIFHWPTSADSPESLPRATASHLNEVPVQFWTGGDTGGWSRSRQIARGRDSGPAPSNARARHDERGASSPASRRRPARSLRRGGRVRSVHRGRGFGLARPQGYPASLGSAEAVGLAVRARRVASSAGDRAPTHRLRDAMRAGVIRRRSESLP